MSRHIGKQGFSLLRDAVLSLPDHADASAFKDFDALTTDPMLLTVAQLHAACKLLPTKRTGMRSPWQLAVLWRQDKQQSELSRLAGVKAVLISHASKFLNISSPQSCGASVFIAASSQYCVLSAPPCCTLHT